MDLKWCQKDEIYKIFLDNELYRQEYLEKKFKYLDLSWKSIESDNTLVAFIDNRPVGLLQLGQAPQDKNLYWMKYVTVHPEFRQMGVARELITEMCRYVSSIEDARIELSSYEKEGEVLIPMVQEISLQFPELSVKHRTWGTPYQDTKLPFLRTGDKVLVDSPDYSGEGVLYGFEEWHNPMTILVKISVEPKIIRCLPKQIKPL